MAVSRRGKGRGRKKNVEKEAAESNEVDTNAAANEDGPSEPAPEPESLPESEEPEALPEPVTDPEPVPVSDDKESADRDEDKEMEIETPEVTEEATIAEKGKADVAVEKDIEKVPQEQKPEEEKKGKKKKKRRRKRAKAEVRTVNEPSNADDEADSDVEVEYVSEKIELPKWDPNYITFNQIFEAFKIESAEPKKEEEEKKEEAPAKKALPKEIDPLLGEDDEERVEDDQPKLSKKKMKEMSRMKIAELKQLVTRPDVVEMHDVNSKDPKLLVYLKAYKNTVPVPRHWCFKRKYLQGKRGFVKPPFELPEFIKQTGIMEMRAAMQEKEDQKTLKSKQRGKVRPKLGKIDIDYQKLHDAFFKYQTKPKMTIHGDLYYEGKEFEIKLKEKKPGDMSDELRTALGMPVGAGKNLIPPPWLIAMQRYGPPPSYPNLKIPGLNAGIPEGASFGYHAGGWGKPPVDENGRPLYGDVFGTQPSDAIPILDDDDVDKTPWGELESESESEEESEEEEEEEDVTGLITPGDAGLITPSGITSTMTTGLETPMELELRKRKEIEDAMETGGDTPSLYTVLQEKQRSVGGAMMGSAHAYDLGAKKAPGEAVELALDPSELELEPSAMAAKYDETMKEREAAKDREDLSDMVADHAASKKTKRKKPAAEPGKPAKKYKEFKF